MGAACPVAEHWYIPWEANVYCLLLLVIGLVGGVRQGKLALKWSAEIRIIKSYYFNWLR